MSLYYDLLNEEAVFIGHKLKYQDLQKKARFSSDYIRFITDYLSKNSDVGMFGHFCEEYPEYVSLYWHFGGRKLQPSKEECKNFIEKTAELNIDDLNDDQKWELFNKGWIMGYDKDVQITDLDEGALGKTAAAAATAAALATGATMNYNHDQVKNIPDQPGDVLVVPEYKDMPNLWGDTKDIKPQKVSVAKPIAKPAAKTVSKQDVKTSVKPAVKTASKPTSKPTVKPNKVVKAVANGVNTFKDAAGNAWDMEKVYNFLMDAEDFRPRAYKDGKVNVNGKRVQRYSIGYGTLAPGNNPRATITEPEARKAKIEHIKKNVLPLIKKKGMAFDNQGQFTSTVSYVYNVGHLPPMLKNGKVDWEKAQDTNVFNGKKNRGLMDRRKAEMYNALIGD